MTDLNKRYFLQNLARCVGRAVAVYHREYCKAEQEAEKVSFFDSYESSYALTLAYPDDLIMDAAQRAGIETEGKEKLEICRELFERQGL